MFYTLLEVVNVEQPCIGHVMGTKLLSWTENVSNTYYLSSEKLTASMFSLGAKLILYVLGRVIM